MKTFSCRAAYGSGGLGRHLAELVEDARESGTLAAYYTTAPRAGDAAGRRVREQLAPLLSRWTPIRFSPGRSADFGFDLFDRAVARTIEPGDVHVGFSLQSLRTFRAARTRGCRELWLVSPTCHVDYAHERYEEAYRRHPIERPWLNEGQRRRAKREYELADVIVVASDYVRDSFIAAGVPEKKLARFDLSAASRFIPGERPDDGIFRVVYVGSLSVAKGTPLLVEAFSRFPIQEAELWLVGGCGTRGMRRWLEKRCAVDSRIRISPGDPLPHLQRADVYVHPSYQDGLSYGVLEAQEVGAPLIVTEDTGAKELISVESIGRVITTGSIDAIVEGIGDAHNQSLVASFAPQSPNEEAMSVHEIETG
jgi:glycosyltransferase involved in cell wall biosynthesis